MKLEVGRIPAFLRNPGATRVVLLHGEDEGTVRHRAETLTTAVVGTRDDPFRVAWLSREDHARLEEEATALAMLGGRRVIRVRDAVDGLAERVRQVAAIPGDSLMILECGILPGRSKLRAVVEALATGASIACYAETAQAIQTAVSIALDAAGVSLDQDARTWLVGRLGDDRGATRGEIDKLVLYAGEARRLDLTDVRACVGDLAAVSLDDALFAATAGNVTDADVSIERALAEGVAPVAVTRAIQAHLGRLYAARGLMAAGSSAADAVRSLRPAVFFKRVGAMTDAAVCWTGPRLMSVLREVIRTEARCKQTGSPDSLLVRRLVSGLARQGQGLRARASLGSH